MGRSVLIIGAILYCIVNNCSAFQLNHVERRLTTKRSTPRTSHIVSPTVAKTSASLTTLRGSHQEEEQNLVDEDLERQAQEWIANNPKRQEWWSKQKAKASEMKQSQSERLRGVEGSLSELKATLGELEQVTGSKLLADGKNKKGLNLTASGWAAVLASTLAPVAILWGVTEQLKTAIDPPANRDPQLW